MTTTDTTVNNLVINVLTQEQYEDIQSPSETELYMVTDEPITSSDVTTALGYTPYSASNPNGYTSNVGTVTSVNNTNPDANGNVTLSIPSPVTVDDELSDTSTNPVQNKVITGALDTKQDVLTAGNGITITQSQDTRSTASVVTVGSNTWQEVTFGNGKFVAVGNSGYVTTSTDGITWSTPVQVDSTVTWRGIIYANNKFVMCGNSKVAYSTNAENWTTVTVGSSTTWGAITYGNSMFIIKDQASVKWATSSDGETWTYNSTGGGTKSNAIIYGGGKFVAVGNNGGRSYSTDGITWTNKSTSRTWNDIIYVNGTYYVAGDSGYTTTSTDAITWTSEYKSLSFTVQELRYNNGVFVAVGNGGETSISTDFNNWNNVIIGNTSSSWYGLANNDSTFVTVSNTSTIATFIVNVNPTISANIDDTLSSTSENPVQNKVIYNVIGDIEALLNNINSGSSS